MSESQFKTQKYQSDYPRQFTNTAHATQWCDKYFAWYNPQHHHRGLAGFTPEQIFTGKYHDISLVKQLSLDERYWANLERFVRGRPTVAIPKGKALISSISPEEIADSVVDVVNFPTLNRVKKEKYINF